MNLENKPPEYLSVVRRNFVPYFADGNVGVRYLRHPSGVIVITLATSADAAHRSPLVGKTIKSFEWEVSENKKHGVNRSKLEICGKSKRGGLQIFPESKICIIKCMDGTVHVVRSGIRATLVEVNDEQLAKDPNLALTGAESGYGYLAIVLPTGTGSYNLLHVPKHLVNE